MRGPIWRGSTVNLICKGSTFPLAQEKREHSIFVVPSSWLIVKHITLLFHFINMRESRKRVFLYLLLNFVHKYFFKIREM